MNFIAKTAIAGALLALAGNAAATTLYTQPFDGTCLAFASQNDTNGNGNFATAYDNFTLAAGATINNVAFTGEYFNPPNQGTITGFTLQIYNDAAGIPGASVYSEFVSGTGGETTPAACGGGFAQTIHWARTSMPSAEPSTGCRSFPISASRRNGAGRPVPAATEPPIRSSSEPAVHKPATSPSPYRARPPAFRNRRAGR